MIRLEDRICSVRRSVPDSRLMPTLYFMSLMELFLGAGVHPTIFIQIFQSMRNACRATADCSLQTDFKVGSPTGTQTQHQNRHDWRISCWAVGSDYIILYELSQPKTLTAFLAHNIYSVVQLLTFGGAALVEKFLPLCKPEIILIPIKGAGSAVWAWVSVALEKLCQVSDNNPDDVIVSLRQ